MTHSEQKATHTSNTIWLTRGLAAVALLSIALLPACSEAERTYDCAQICDKWSDCYDSDLDKTECVDECEDEGQMDDDFADRASDCEACIDGQDCSSATLDCGDVCTGVIIGATTD